MSGKMKTVFFCVIFISMGCGIMPPFVPDNHVDSGTSADCQAACDNLKKLGCDGWEGSPGPDDNFGTEDDMPCETVCADIMSEPTATLYPICTAKATDCSSVTNCFK